uniref:XPG_I_2 domain-containing protein n=1 Tax=Macrostomum lignano TaxID=282301 RepID=A0A1I8HIY6_9PLAT
TGKAARSASSCAAWQIAPPAASSCWKLAGPIRAIALLPILTYDVFGQAAVDRGFPVATVLTGDADEQSATLAGRLGCPLLTGDSDFFLYPLPGGVIPSDSLDLSDEALSSGESCMRCCIYQQSACRLKPLNNLALRPELTALWASLAGNDYVSENEAAEARRTLGIRGYDCHGAITESIRWTHRFELAEECLAELRRRLQPELMSRFDASLRHYQLKPEHEALRLGADSAKIEFPEAAPTPLTDSHRRRRKLVFFIDALLYQRVILPIGIEHPNLPGLFESTRALRSIAYSLENFRTDRDNKEEDNKEDSNKLQVIEYVRSGTEVLQVPVKLSTRRHRCPSADSWRCALEHIDASEDADKQLTALLPEKLAGSQRLRLALHLLRLSLNGGDRRSRCVTRALLALCLLRHDASKDSDNDDDEEDEGPPKKRAGSTVDFDCYASPRIDGAQVSSHQRSKSVYLELLHQFNAFQAHIVSLMLFLQAHSSAGEDDRLLGLAAAAAGWPLRLSVAADMLDGRLDWDRCLASLADRLRAREPPARACSGWPTGSPLLGCRLLLLLLTEAAES